MVAERIPPMKAVMTPFPWSVDASAPLAEARRLMREHEVHHLPVVDEHDLVGVISDRDVRRLLASRFGLSGDADLLVSDAMATDVYKVDLNTPLDHVLVEMGTHHFGCALITREHRLAGIVTHTDICRLFAEHLGRLRPEGDDAA
ncbi:MAG: CBS domain-containing protein [Pseudomonadales bacterium]|nr:CBS domain-containing protein [Pseudomonadales bacterium]